MTLSTTTPGMPSRAASALICGSTSMPRVGGAKRPVAIRRGTTRFTSSTGTAKPMPAEPPEGL